MTDLLSNVLDAHGGLERWNRVTSLVVEGSLGGPFWAAKGWPDVYADQRITLDPHRFDITFAPFPEPRKASRMTAGPEHLELLDDTGSVVEARDNPRDSFPDPATSPAWDAIQTAYFTSCACWNYFTAPFLFTYPGVHAEEIEPWDEDGASWRRLAVTFPRELPNHNRRQSFYFDDDFLLRRMDYKPDVTATPIAHYTDGHETFGGFVFPTRRAIHLRAPDGSANKAFAPITLSIDAVQVTSS